MKIPAREGPITCVALMKKICATKDGNNDVTATTIQPCVVGICVYPRLNSVASGNSDEINAATANAVNRLIDETFGGSLSMTT